MHSTPIDTITPDGTAPLHGSIPHIIVYTRPGCGQCRMLIRRLAAKTIPVITIDVDAHDGARRALADAGVTALPVTVAHNIFDRSVHFRGVAPDQAGLLIKRYPRAFDMAVEVHGIAQDNLERLEDAALDPTETMDAARWRLLAAEASGSTPATDIDPDAALPPQLNSDGTIGDD